MVVTFRRRDEARLFLTRARLVRTARFALAPLDPRECLDGCAAAARGDGGGGGDATRAARATARRGADAASSSPPLAPHAWEHPSHACASVCRSHRFAYPGALYNNDHLIQCALQQQPGGGGGTLGAKTIGAARGASADPTAAAAAPPSPVLDLTVPCGENNHACIAELLRDAPIQLEPSVASGGGAAAAATDGAAAVVVFRAAALPPSGAGGASGAAEGAGGADGTPAAEAATQFVFWFNKLRRDPGAILRDWPHRPLAVHHADGAAMRALSAAEVRSRGDVIYLGEPRSTNHDTSHAPKHPTNGRPHATQPPHHRARFFDLSEFSAHNGGYWALAGGSITKRVNCATLRSSRTRRRASSPPSQAWRAAGRRCSSSARRRPARRRASK